MLIQEGDLVPGGWGIATEFDSINFGGTETIDDVGRVYYHGSVRGPGIDETNNRGAWILSSNGTGQLLLREGQLMDLGDAGIKQVKNFMFSASAGTQTGRAPGVNSYGDVAFLVYFTDDTKAIVVSQLAPTCPGDVNFDGFVNFDDLLMVLANWGINGAIGQNGDADEDGDIDFGDLLIVLSNWGTICNPM